MRPRTFWLGFAGLGVAIMVAGTLLGTDRGPGALPPADGHADTVVMIATALGIIAAYFLPAIVAKHRGHRNETAIFVLDLLLGWTLIGWVVAMVWAFTQPSPARPTIAADFAPDSENERQPCPHCAEAILPEARVCHYCRRELSAGWASAAAE